MLRYYLTFKHLKEGKKVKQKKEKEGGIPGVFQGSTHGEANDKCKIYTSFK